MDKIKETKPEDKLYLGKEVKAGLKKALDKGLKIAKEFETKLKRKNYQYGQLANKYKELKEAYDMALKENYRLRDEIKKATELERKRIIELIDEFQSQARVMDYQGDNIELVELLESIKSKMNKEDNYGK